MSREIEENKPGSGYFQMEIRVGSSEKKVYSVPAIKIGYWTEFEERNLEKGVPVVAFRDGSGGECSVIVNDDVLTAKKITLQTAFDEGRAEMHNREITTGGRFRRVNLQGYVSTRKKIPTQVLVEGKLKNGNVPFSAKIYFVPSAEPL